MEALQETPMTAALLLHTPRPGYRFFFVALFIAGYPLWHADFPMPVGTATEVTVDTPVIPASTERLGACRGQR
jgi:hypothetical protein